MSYGANAPTLDFTRFHTACLSGRNGHGKSALLDAVTWALWQKARGGSTRSDEVLRVGQSHMEVEFVFRVEGARYRVLRQYVRTASGKTNRHRLELHHCSNSGDPDRLASGGSTRETQEKIDQVVGVDYRTFVNSAFLVQGRSGDFTKRPSRERKEILGRILNLDRYVKLSEFAKNKKRDAERDRKRAESEEERLEDSLANEEACRASFAELEGEIERRSAELGFLRKRETDLVLQVERIEARRRDAESKREVLRDAEEAVKACAADAAAARERIAAADVLISRGESIRRDQERYLALLRERETLDAQREAVGRLKGRVVEAEKELAELQHSLERKLALLEREADHHREAIREIERLQSERPHVERQWQEALSAGKALQALRGKKRRSEKLKREMEIARRAVANENSVLKSRLRDLDARITEKTAVVGNLRVLSRRLVTLKKDAVRHAALASELEEVLGRGQARKAEIGALDEALPIHRRELRERRSQLNLLVTEERGTCPTCGVELTPEHREEAAAKLRHSVEEVERRLAAGKNRKTRLEGKREALRSAYRSTRKRVDALAELTRELPTVEARIRQGATESAELAELTKERKSVAHRLEEKAFARPDRDLWENAKKELRVLAFDDGEYDRVLKASALAEGFAEMLAKMDAETARKGALTRTVEKVDRERRECRGRIEDGSAFGDLPDAIERIRADMEKVGFDEVHLAVVREGIHELRDAERRAAELAVALRDRHALEAHLKELEDRFAAESKKKDRFAAEIAALERGIAAGASVETDLAQAAAERGHTEEELNTRRVALGGLKEKLENFVRDRRRLADVQRDRRRKRKEELRYEILRQAFSKDGIPALIIEQTLPEVRRRTNDLLCSLTDGRMRIDVETRAEKKTGGTKEVLDIKVCDELGEYRPYETYSGGEAFRVDFALRIALSELLANRAGTRIQTLVVDEGFGTQDAEGIRHLVDVIRRIQDRFEKILVISHIPEIKDAFPVRIEVEKDPVTGSRFEVIGA